MQKIKIVLLSVIITASVCIAGQSYALQLGTKPVVETNTESNTIAESIPVAQPEAIVERKETISAKPLSLEDRVRKLEERVNQLENNK